MEEKKNVQSVEEVKEEPKAKKKLGKRKLFSLALCMMMFVTIFSISAFAVDGTTAVNPIGGLLGGIGDGLSEFMPEVAQAGVTTVDTLFLKADGSFTILGTFIIVGIVISVGLGIWGFIKRRANRV